MNVVRYIGTLYDEAIQLTRTTAKKTYKAKRRKVKCRQF